MSHPFDRLQLDQTNHASLIFTPCPGTKGTSVQQALDTLQDAGASALITLMPATELAAHQVEQLGEYCRAAGLVWLHCPIEDDHAPQDDFVRAWQHAGPQVHQLLNDGKTVAIHCKGGSGRTGLLAAQILLERGESKAQVKSRVQALRPYALTLQPHVEYFAQLAGV